MPIWLGIDCGGTFLKAGLYDQTGRLLGLARCSLPVLSDQPGWAERDMETLWQATCRVVGDVVATSGVAPASIRGVGISAQGKGLFLLDRDRQPLGRAMLSSDQRALGRVRAWQRQGLPEKLYPRTLQTLWTGHPVSLLRWLKDERPAVYQRIGSIMMAHDYLRFRLTGKLGAEITNISESNLYDMQSGRYDAGLAGLCGIGEVMEALPAPIGSAEVVGGVTVQAATETGLAAGTPVVGGLFDVVATSLAAGIVDERRLNAILGTWSVATGVTDHVAQGLSIPFVYGRHAEAGLYIVHDASPTSAANLEWLATQFGDHDYAAMDKAVAALPPAASDVQFLPFLYGSNAGLGMKAGFYGLQALHGRAHLLQAVYEGVIFSFLHHLDRLRQRFPSTQTLRVTGGPARSQVWMQMLADAAGLPLELPAVEETGCLGAAMAAAVGTGAHADFRAAMAAFESPLRRVEPVSSRFPLYAQKRAAYRELIAALAGYEARLAILRNRSSQGTAP